MKNVLVNISLVLLSLAWAVPSPAEDIDLFMGPKSLAEKSAPNVLFILDNTANWNTPFLDEKEAFRKVFESIKARVTSEDPDKKAQINVGILMYSETGSPNNAISGGYVRAAIRPMGAVGPDGGNYADKYYELIKGLDIRNDKANGGDAGLSMAEAYLYFAGREPYAGISKAKTDYQGNTFNTASCCGNSLPVWRLSENALDSFSTDRLYNSPIKGGSCGKNYIIYISNGPAQDSASGSRISAELLASVGGVTTQISLNPSGSADTTADEWARFMKHKATEEITTFTVDVLPGRTGQGPGWSRLLKSMAEESGGVPYSVTDSTKVAEGLAGAIGDIFDKILAVNSVFASVALPAASNAQSTFLNQVFIGQFRPDKDAKPRWPGNLKQYKLGRDPSDQTVLRVQDVDGDSVVDPLTGFIEKCTKSYWSKPDAYWTGKLALDLEPTDVCKENGSDSSESNSPDGPIVEKGGQAQRLRAIALASTRKVYTCSPVFADCATTATLKQFNSSNTDISLARVGLAPSATATELAQMINWARGEDVDDEDGNTLTTGNIRSSVHGDVVHSRPVAINYGNNTAPKVVVFYSGNDGMLRAINGNRTDITGAINPPGAPVPGDELWAFMPPEFYGSIKTLRTNTATINFPSSSKDAPTTGISKPYGIDGPIVAFDGYVPDLDEKKKFLYAGMRRAGRALYAFDVTNITATGSPAPTMLWKRGCPDLGSDTGCTGGWSGIGQTWSQPNIIYSKGYKHANGEMKPMLIMGGGYDACEDVDDNTKNHNCTSIPKPKGSLIYLIDALSGAILATFDTDRSVAGGVTVVTVSDKDRTAEFAYATDTGGNVYRISGGTEAAPEAIGSADPTANEWKIRKIATLGCNDKNSCDANRKFLFGPDVVRNPKKAGQLAILVGSGDREKPLENYVASNSVKNFFFALFDYPTSGTWLNDVTDAATKCNADMFCYNTLTQVTTSGPASGVTISPKGWKLPLASGEQVVTGAITVADVTNFSTHVPAKSVDACAANLGSAKSYSLDFRDADGDETVVVGGGLVPTPVAGIVILDDGSKVPFCIGCGGESSAIGAKLVGSGVKWKQPKSRVYWKIQK